MEKTVRRGISANALKLLAMAAMLLDHLWATVVSGNLWMTCVVDITSSDHRWPSSLQCPCRHD